MKKFVEFVKHLHDVQMNFLTSKLMKEKIPCAFFTPMISASLDIIDQIRNAGINLTTILTSDKRYSDFKSDLTILHINDINKQPHPKYCFVVEDFGTFVTLKRLLEYNLEPIFLEFKEFPGTVNFDFYIEHLPRIFEVYQDLIDDESRDVLIGYMLAQISKRISFCKFSNNVQYILNGFEPKPNEIVIDCGVCDGATSAMFADFGCRVIGFEMDSENYKIASEVAKNKNFVVENFGLGDENKSVTYRHAKDNIGGSKISINGTLKTQIITLDSYVQEHHLPSVDFIKMDVEGAELSILKGATNTITRFKPRLALSAYHKPEDIFTLYEFVKSIRPDYEFAFRHYATTPNITPSIFVKEIVEYCRELDMPLEMCGLAELVLFAR